MTTDQAHSRTIVIIEDEQDTAEMFAEMARLSGYQVSKSLGGTRAVDLIAQKRPDIVLLDLMMPDVSGLEVLSNVRRDPRLKNIPIVIVSARGTLADIQEGLKLGATGYLTKPVAFTDLKAALNQALASSLNPPSV